MAEKKKTKAKVKRVERKDAKRVSEFLQRVFTEDKASGGDPSIQTEDAVTARCEAATMFVCIEDGKVLGALQRFKGGHIELWGQWYTYQYHNLLAVDHNVYKADPREAVRIARELSLASANAWRDNKEVGDFIIVEGPTKSRGSSWCRILGMSESFKGDWSWFILPFNLIWDRLKATEAL